MKLVAVQAVGEQCREASGLSVELSRGIALRAEWKLLAGEYLLQAFTDLHF